MRTMPLFIITQREEKWPSHTKEGQYDIVPHYYSGLLKSSSFIGIKEFLQFGVNLAQLIRKGRILLNIPSDWSGPHYHIDLTVDGIQIGTEGTRQSDGKQEGIWYAPGETREQKAAHLYDRLSARYKASYGESLKLPAGDEVWNWGEIPEIKYSSKLSAKYPPTPEEMATDKYIIPYTFDIKDVKIEPLTYKNTVEYYKDKFFPSSIIAGGIVLALAAVFFFLLS